MRASGRCTHALPGVGPPVELGRDHGIVHALGAQRGPDLERALVPLRGRPQVRLDETFVRQQVFFDQRRGKAGYRVGVQLRPLTRQSLIEFVIAVLPPAEKPVGECPDLAG